MAIPLDPWQLAKDRYLEDLNDEEKALFNGASSASVEAFFYSASAAQKLHQSESKVRAMAAKLKPLTDAVEEYGRAIDVLANSSSLVLCPIWGSIRVVLQVREPFSKTLPTAQWLTLWHVACERIWQILREGCRYAGKDRRCDTQISTLPSHFSTSHTTVTLFIYCVFRYRQFLRTDQKHLQEGKKKFRFVYLSTK
jgi:hypothetical protein